MEYEEIIEELEKLHYDIAKYFEDLLYICLNDLENSIEDNFSVIESYDNYLDKIDKININIKKLKEKREREAKEEYEKLEQFLEDERNRLIHLQEYLNYFEEERKKIEAEKEEEEL